MKHLMRYIAIGILTITFTVFASPLSAQQSQGQFSYGGAFGFTFNRDYIYLQIAPQVGYHIVDPLTLYFGISYEFFQQDKGNNNTIGALVGFRYEFVTFVQSSDYSTGLLLTPGYNINYVIPNLTSNYLQNVWKLGLGIRQSFRNSASN